jgi:hypothetical protein
MAGPASTDTFEEWPALPYARAAPDPPAAMLEFLDRSYQAGARLGGWDPRLRTAA